MTVDEALDLRQQTAKAVQHLAGLLKALPDKVYNGAFLDEALTLPLIKALQDPAETRCTTITSQEAPTLKVASTLP
jgi:hypothetical protein